VRAGHTVDAPERARQHRLGSAAPAVGLDVVMEIVVNAVFVEREKLAAPTSSGMAPDALVCANAT